MPASLLSPAADRLLTLLTPELVLFTDAQYRRPAVWELQRLGLIEAQAWGDRIAVRLSDTGLVLRPSMHN